MIEIQLTQGYKAQIDNEDYELVSKYKWHARKDGSNVYAAAYSKEVKSTILLHRLVMSVTDSSQLVDHKD
jgi:hypothetical protein